MLVTPLAQRIVPPPMADREVALSGSVRDVAFSPTVDRARGPGMALLLSHGAVALVAPAASTVHSEVDLLQALQLPPNRRVLRCLVWATPCVLLVVAAGNSADEDVLYAVHLTVDVCSETNNDTAEVRQGLYSFRLFVVRCPLLHPVSKTHAPSHTPLFAPFQIKEVRSVIVPRGVATISHMEDDARLVLVQTRDRRLYKVATDEPELMLLPWQPEGADQAPAPAADPDMDFGCAVSDDEGEDEGEEGNLDQAGAGRTAAFQLPALCERLVHLSLGPSHARQSAVIGLTARHELLVNGRTLATDCNSFAVHDAFVVCCSVQHVLCLLDRCATPEGLQYRTAKRHAYDHAVRAVERGSRIVALPRQGTGVVLQMPRGNLEAVVPRPLVLHRCYTLLDAGHYGRACTLLRKHRLSLNVLCDYNPDVFEQNVSSFVAGVNNVDHLNLFLSELADEDVTWTMYPPLNAEVGVA